MSFLTRTAFRSAATTLRTPAAPRVSAAAFSTTLVQRKSATDAVKEPLKKVDRAVSDKLVDAIEVGETATQKVKEVSGVSASEAKGKASELSGQAKGKASELSGEAKGKASELKGEAKSKI